MSTKHHTTDDWATDAVIANATDGDEVRLDRYLNGPLRVTRKYATIYGVVLVVKSGGGSIYRLRSTGSADDLLLEKSVRVGDWEPFLRVQARIED